MTVSCASLAFAGWHLTCLRQHTNSAHCHIACDYRISIHGRFCTSPHHMGHMILCAPVPTAKPLAVVCITM